MTQSLSFQQVVQLIDGRGIMPKTPPSIARTVAALEQLDLRYPGDLRRVIVVAGTNGKGTTSKSLATMLRRQGHKVGFYCSPHLVSPVERIQVNDEPISEALFVELFQEIDALTGSLNLTHFETLTAMMARLFFYRDPVDYAILEVGLGGLFDSTNAVPHQTCVITKLGLDHEDILGAGLPAIAEQKFGIIQAGAQVFHLPFSSEIDEVVRSFQKRLPDVSWSMPPAHTCSVKMMSNEPKYFLNSAWGSTPISLLGERAAENMNLALHTLAGLGENVESALPVLAEVRWPGRMQKIQCSELAAPLYLSGDHNLQGVLSLREIVAQFSYERLWLVIGVGEKKDAAAMLNELAKIPRVEFFGVSGFFRARTTIDLKTLLPAGSLIFENIQNALDSLKGKTSKGDLVLISGSLYLVGETLKRLSEASAFQP